MTPNTALAVAVLLLAACAPAVPSSSPLASQSVPPAQIEVASAAQAAALVLASEPRFAGISPLRPDMVGQAAWYEAYETGEAYRVAVTVGSGDCLAGCIDRHTWTYDVTPDGSITLAGEQGDEVEYSPPQPTASDATTTISLTSGPHCPVEQLPADPNCDARPVPGAEVSVFDPRATLVAAGESDVNGQVVLELPTGAYFVEVEPIEGLMGTPEGQAFSIVGGHGAGLLFAYDTGIR